MLNRNNRLYHVNDDAKNGTEGLDLKDHGSLLCSTIGSNGKTSNSEFTNYSYDELGNLVYDNSEGIVSIDWNIQNKIRRIISRRGKPSLEFKYDGAGNRAMKVKKRRSSGVTLPESEWEYTYYVRDANGNVMGVYTTDVKAEAVANDTRKKYTRNYNLTEANIYGSSRLGVANMTVTTRTQSFTAAINTDGSFSTTDVNFHSSLDPAANSILSLRKGSKSYELSDHLGNVLSTVSDRKIGKDNAADGKADYYIADVRSAANYYPFGMIMPERNYYTHGYRYGFTGKEKDLEGMGGGGSTYDYGFRIYNPQIAKFLSVDPLTSEAPSWSPYHSVWNNPIVFTDPDGRWPIYIKGAVI